MKKLAIILGCAAVALLLAVGIYYYRHRYVRSDQNLLAILPEGDYTTFYANVELLRRVGMLQLLTGTRVSQEKDYQKFVHEINFDYSRDLDRIAGSTNGSKLLFLLQGRFDWERIRRYPQGHGGSCIAHVCSVPAVTPGRWASFHLIQPNVLALAIGSDAVAVNILQPPAHPRKTSLPPEPVWVQLSDRFMKTPQDLPLPLRIFAISLQSANPVIVSAAAAAPGTSTAFKLQLDAACTNEAAADTIRNQLEMETKMIQMMLKRPGQSANPADLTGLLTAGSFQTVHKHVLGSWPVRLELLRTLQ